MFFDGGTLIAGDISVANQFDWSSGTIGGVGTLTICNGAGSALNLIIGGVGGRSGWTLEGGRTSSSNQGLAPFDSFALDDGVPSTFTLADGAKLVNEGSFTVLDANEAARIDCG